MKPYRFRSCAADQGGRRTIFWAGITVAWISFSSFGQVAVTNFGSFTGGGISTSESYNVRASLGCIGGISAIGTVCNSGGGPFAQPGNAKALRLTVPASVNENAAGQLGGTATMDDDTATTLAGSDINWSSPSWPILSITTSGVVSASAVFTNTASTVSGYYLGYNDSAGLLVLDTNQDNYGIYSGDSLPDWWQVAFFGTNNPLGVAGATNCTGQNNLYTYTADLNPTNPASVFVVVSVSNQPPSQRVVCFRTASTGRVYRLLYATNLTSGVWTNLPGASWMPGLPGQMSLNDTNAATVRFYRVHVQVP